GGDGSAGDHADYRKDVFGMLIDYYESEMGVFQGAYSPEGNDPNRFHRLPTLESLDEGYLNAFIPTPSYHERDGGNGVLNTLQQIRDAIDESSPQKLPHFDSEQPEPTGVKVGSTGDFRIEDFDPTI